MPQFLYEHSDGKQYQIEAPDESTARDIINQQFPASQPRTQFGWDAAMNRLRSNNPMGRFSSSSNTSDLPNVDVSQSINELKGLGGQIPKGVPIAGNFMPNSKEMQEYQQQHPVLSGMGRVEGGVASTAPFAYGMLPASTGFLRNLATMGAFNTGLNEADTVTRKLVNGEDFNWGDVREYTNNLAWGLGTAGLSAGALKLLSPGRPTGAPARPQFSAEQQAALDAQDKMIKEAMGQNNSKELNEAIKEILGQKRYNEINPQNKPIQTPYQTPQLPPGLHTIDPEPLPGWTNQNPAGGGGTTTAEAAPTTAPTATPKTGTSNPINTTSPGATAPPGGEIPPGGVPPAVTVPPWLDWAAGPTVMTGLGYELGGATGAELGGFAGIGNQKALEQIAKTPFGRAWFTNQLGNKGAHQAILNSLGYSAGRNAIPGVTVDESNQ